MRYSHLFTFFVTVCVACILPASAREVRAVAGGNCVALTFDDGPHATLTPHLLTVLRQKGVRATFFVVGQRVRAWPQIVRQMHVDGHEIGNHSWNHPNLTSLSSGAVKNQIDRTDQAVLAAAGVAPTLIRAPYGALNTRVMNAVPNRTFVGWSVDTLDWLYRNTERTQRVSVSRARGGSIVLMHDTHARTVAAVSGIIDGLRAQGYSLGTVSELLSGRCNAPAPSFFAGFTWGNERHDRYVIEDAEP